MLRHATLDKIKDWFGLNSFASTQNLDLGWWYSSSNIVVTNDGSAACLRSPANFNTALATGNPILSVFDYAKTTGNLILFDIKDGSTVTTYSTTGTSNTSVRTGQADARWKRLAVNDWAYSINGTEFVQTNGTNTYRVGIDPPTSAPTISIITGGAGALADGVTVSYAYRNSTTGGVSTASPASNDSGAGSNKLRIAVAASGQAGVDGIVLFITQDGGSVRYLYVDASGNPVVNANTSGNIDINMSLLTNLDTLTPETAYNTVPPIDAFFMFRWKQRLVLCDFRTATTRQQLRYNSFETVFYGIPWECWWPTNAIAVPSKGDAARSGIETPVGALILGENDSYLLRGSLTDKVSAPEATVSVTEAIQPMNWSIGTRSPYTLKATPFGEIWLDQNKRIQIWNHDGFPVEAGLPIRNDLDAIQDTDAARNMAEAEWFQHGKQGGHYVLTASTTGSTNNKLFIITAYKDPEKGDMRFACGVSDIPAQCLAAAKVSGRKRLFAGQTDRLREIFDLDTQGAGWSSSQARIFKTIAGNNVEFCYWHSLKFDATSIKGLTLICANLDGTESQTIELEQDTGAGGAYYGLIDAYGYRKVFVFSFSSDDTQKRVIQNFRVAYGPKRRLL